MKDRLIFSPYLINLSNIKASSIDEEIIVLPNVIDFGMDIDMVFNEKIRGFFKNEKPIWVKRIKFIIIIVQENLIFMGESVCVFNCKYIFCM